MRGTRVDDCWGVRWTVRARYERHADPESEVTRRVREPTLLAGLPAMLAPHGHPVDVRPVDADRSDDELRRHAAALLGAQAATVGGALGSLVAIWRGARALAEPTDRFWLVELTARGRIRRGASWQVTGRDEAARVAAVIADAVRAGRVPQPAGARLIAVVDERLTVYGAPR